MLRPDEPHQARWIAMLERRGVVSVRERLLRGAIAPDAEIAMAPQQMVPRHFAEAWLKAKERAERRTPWLAMFVIALAGIAFALYAWWYWLV